MKKILFALLSVVLSAPSVFALAGGPWDAGVPGNATKVSANDPNGTYQGTIRGKNILGILRVGTAASASSALPGYWANNIWADRIDSTAKGSARTDTAGSAAGTAIIFMEGYNVLANVDAVADLAGRTFTGVMDGATTNPRQFYVENPNYTSRITTISNLSITGTNLGDTTVSGKNNIGGTDPNNSAQISLASGTNSGITTGFLTNVRSDKILHRWAITDNASVSANFDAKLSKYWASNTFSGSGRLSITKFDMDGYNADLAANPESASPYGHTATREVKIRVSGAKTSDTALTPSNPTIPDGMPTIIQITP